MPLGARGSINKIRTFLFYRELAPLQGGWGAMYRPLIDALINF